MYPQATHFYLFFFFFFSLSLCRCVCLVPFFLYARRDPVVLCESMVCKVFLFTHLTQTASSLVDAGVFFFPIVLALLLFSLSYLIPTHIQRPTPYTLAFFLLYHSKAGKTIVIHPLSFSPLFL
jgi:hypothetical protein